mmetsp:Transcript_17657/g.31953  ORF Transcript_17657/g.31953 Transcript_17657/m.31953 type:complete len:347 (+) Transcript_17657:153-1193(+)
MKTFKRFDLYRKVPRDLTEPTVSGAAVSCCTVTIAVYLFITEAMLFTQRRWDSEMFVGESKTEEKLQINLDITLPAMPCEILSFDAQDVMGSHEVDAHGNLFKERLTSKGDLIAREEIQSSRFGAFSALSRHFSFSYDNQDVDRIKNMVNSGEGCRITGFVKVNKVPGNVHLSTYSHAYLFGSFYQESRKINITHKVNHISFGADRDISYVKKTFPGTGVVSPLDGVVQVCEQQKDGTGIDSAIFEYYTKVVSTTYVPRDAEPVHVYQFTANSNKIANQQMPSLYLRYDFSPVTVKYVEVKESLSHFLVQICAVIGGVFTVAGMLDSMVHRSIVHLAKKAQLGKLG